MRRLLFLAALFCTDRALGQSNFEGAQLGGRTTMMGGAAVATGADEATAFINPAGITRIPGSSFSFSTFVVNLDYRNIKNPLDPGARLGVEQPDARKVTLRIVPNTFCMFLDGPPKDDYSGRSRHKYSLCAAGTERERLSFAQNRFDQQGSDRFTGISQATESDFVRSTVALSWGIDLGNKTSLGVTFRTDNTRYRDYSSTTSFSGQGGYGELQAVSLAREAWSWDTSLTIGITSNISRIVTLGAALTTPSQHLFGKYTSEAPVSFGVDRGYGVVQDDGDFRYNHPGSLRLGLGFSWPRLTIEVNGSFYGPQQQRARANFDRRLIAFSPDGQAETVVGRGNVSEKGRAVTNVSLGSEYFLYPDFSLLCGVGTDFSGIHPRVDQDLGDVLFRQQRDALHASFGISSYGRNGRLLFGVQGEYSWGQVLVADSTTDVPKFVALPQVNWGASLIISGQLNISTMVEAAERAATPRSSSDDEDEEQRRGGSVQ